MNQQSEAGESATEPVAEQPSADTGNDQAAPAADQAAEDDKKAARGGGFAAWLALLIALLAAGGLGYLWTLQQAQQQTNQRTEQLSDELRERVGEVERLETRLNELIKADSDLADDLKFLEQQLSSQSRQLDLVPARVERMERALEALPGVADQARSAWLLSEAEYYLRIGNAQLNLARNADIALRALELADEKLRDVGDPGLVRVRRVLADEMTALRGVPRPDAEGIALQLSSLARSLVELPLTRQTPESYGQADGRESARSGWERAWRSIKDALMSIVRVKRTDEVVVPLRTEIEESILLRGMETELDVARLALIRGDASLYRDALAGVQERLSRHFDGDASSVQAAQRQLEQLSGAELPETMPDISASLNLLLRYGTDLPEA
jgi:uroporphyrin-3 C-methyltransferase